MPPIRMLSTSSTTKPIPGRIALRSHMLASTPSARMIVIQNRIVLAGSAACTSVYDAPVNLLRPPSTKP